VRGFFNSCRHRGAQICKDGHGRSARLVCPYHQWSYDLDGRLVGANRMHDGFDKASHGLTPIPTESVGGIICVALSDDVPDFTPFRDGFADLAASHDFINMKLVKEQIIVEKANWKLAMENSRECYHCPVGHPELCLSYYDSTMLNYDGSEDAVFRDYEAGLKAMGLHSGPYTGLWYGTSRFPLNPGTESQTLDGRRACRKLIAPEGSGVLRFSLQAHSYNYAMPDYVFTFSVLPISAQETLMHSKWMVHKDAVEGVDYDLDHLTGVWWITNQQDVDLTENNQRGVNSFGYRPGPYAAATESLLMRFIEFYGQTAEGFLGPRHPGLAAVRAA
jgi:Rieske 2Fe-2S family protein